MRMERKALIFFVFVTAVCFGAEDLPASKSSVEKFLKDYVRKETCSLPEDMDGKWATTLWGNITMSGFVLQTDLNFGGTDVNELECYLTSDTGETVLRGRKTIHIDGEEFEILTCIEIIPRNTDNYHIIVKTDRNAKLGNEPLKLRSFNASSSGSTDFVSCEEDSAKWLHGNMVRIDKVKSAAVSCPPALIGSFSVNFLDRKSSARCPGGAVMVSSVEPNSALVIDYTDCSEGDGQEDEETKEQETFWCVAATGAGITVYQDGQEKNPFSCVSVKADPVGHGDRMIYTQRLGACGSTWTKSLVVPDDVWFRIASLSHTQESEDTPTNKDDSQSNYLLQNDSPGVDADNGSLVHKVIFSKVSHQSSKGEEKTEVKKTNDQTRNGQESNVEAGTVTQSRNTKEDSPETAEFAKDGAVNPVPKDAIFTLSLLLVAIILA